MAETLRRSEIMRRLCAAIQTHDSRTPDSLGDRMFCCRLAYVNAQAGFGIETTAEIIGRAEALLQEGKE